MATKAGPSAWPLFAVGIVALMAGLILLINDIPIGAVVALVVAAAVLGASLAIFIRAARAPKE